MLNQQRRDFHEPGRRLLRPRAPSRNGRLRRYNRKAANQGQRTKQNLTSPKTECRWAVITISVNHKPLLYSDLARDTDRKRLSSSMPLEIITLCILAWCPDGAIEAYHIGRQADAQSYQGMSGRYETTSGAIGVIALGSSQVITEAAAESTVGVGLLADGTLLNGVTIWTVAICSWEVL
jgi:hypothetical protein